MDQRIVIILGDPGFEGMQEDLGIFGIILSQGIVERRASAGHGKRGE